MNGTYSSTLVLCETPEICSTIPRICSGKWMDELIEEGILLMDVDSETLNVSQRVTVLIGSGYSRVLSNGFGVVQMRLGWTLSGLY